MTTANMVDCLMFQMHDKQRQNHQLVSTKKMIMDSREVDKLLISNQMRPFRDSDIFNFNE